MELYKIFKAVAVTICLANLCFGYSRALIISLAILATYHNKRILNTIKVLPRDLRAIKLLRKLYKSLADYEKKDVTIVDLFREQVSKRPDKILFYYKEQTWSFSDVEKLSNKVANAFLELGYEKGDVVALLMENRPEYVAIWLGLAKVGVVTALVNTNLKDRSFLHCLNAAEAKCLIYSGAYASVVADVFGDLQPSVEIFRFDGPSSSSSSSSSESVRPVRDLSFSLQRASDEFPSARPRIGFRDKVLLVYTSGTTGLPKAAVILHHRVLTMSLSASGIIGLRENDIIYNPLPLYHLAGGLLGIAGALCCGFSSVLREKFSATSYWPDCIKYNCTVAQYIGEMCRYVLMVPDGPEDTRHKVRLVFGNGMSPSIWTGFKERFRLDRICEIYGSTEGNTNLVSLDETVGAVGFLPKIIPDRYLPMAVIKVDEYGEPIRNSRGFCVRCAPNEPGTFVGMIMKSDATREFNGYVGNKKENGKKVIEDVFREGDRAFLSGDILVMDEMGYLYFKDRIGNTFKWKGENVSTAEVEEVISSVVGLSNVLVYGVKVGDSEGRAGMATVIDPNSEVDLKELAAQVDRCLPVYARPLFLRLADRAELTGTYKVFKLNFQKEGFNPEKIKDKLYFKNGSDGYVTLTKQIYENIINANLQSDKLSIPEAFWMANSLFSFVIKNDRRNQQRSTLILKVASLYYKYCPVVYYSL